MIRCNKCEEVKSPTEYRKTNINKSGKTGICRPCKNEYEKIQKKAYFQNPNNRDKRKGWWKEHISKPGNKEKHKESDSKWQKYNPNYKIQYDKEYRANPENWEKIKKYKNERYKSDPEYRIMLLTRGRISSHLKNGEKRNSDEIIELLGCSPKDYKIHLENLFDENMNWDNHGTYWEIDHITQLCLGGTFHYSNTRPLEVSENRKRSRTKLKP